MGWIERWQRGKARKAAKTRAQASHRPQLLPSEQNVLSAFDTHGQHSITFGRLTSGESIGIPHTTFFPSTHVTVRGHTGTGKSFFVLALLKQLFGEAGLAVVDLKQELAEILLQTLLPAWVSKQSRIDQEQIAWAGVSVMNPYGCRQAHMNLLTPREGISAEEQALDVCRFFAIALGDELSYQMERPLRMAIALLIELGQRYNFPLSPLELAFLLSCEPYRLRLAGMSESPMLRHYFISEFSQVPAKSLGAVQVRLDALLASGPTRRCLCAPGFTTMTAEPKQIATVATMNPSAGSGLREFFLPVIVSELSRAILSRGIERTNRPLVAAIDEWQLAVRDIRGAKAFSDLLTLSRAMNTSLLLANQHMEQLPSAELAESLENVAVSAVFRTSAKEARAHTPFLPDDPEVLVSKQPDKLAYQRQLETPVQARKRRAEEHIRLPNRQLWLTLKKWGHQAVRMTTPTLDLDDLRRCADRLPHEIRDRLMAEQGSLPCDLGRLVEHRRAHMLAIADGKQSLPVPRLSDGTAVELGHARQAKQDTPQRAEQRIHVAQPQTRTASIENTATTKDEDNGASRAGRRVITDSEITDAQNSSADSSYKSEDDARMAQRQERKIKSAPISKSNTSPQAAKKRSRIGIHHLG